jgi:hypothetical protein
MTLIFTAMSIHHNFAKVEEGKWGEQNYKLFILNQQNDAIQPVCVIYNLLTMLLKTTVTKECINKVTPKHVIFDYYMQGFGLLAWCSLGQHSYGMLPDMVWFRQALLMGCYLTWHSLGQHSYGMLPDMMYFRPALLWDATWHDVF